MASENPDITLAVLRQEDLRWVREESPVDTVHVQRQKTDSSEMALLKTQMAAMTEAMRAMQVAVESLAAPQPPQQHSREDATGAKRWGTWPSIAQRDKAKGETRGLHCQMPNSGG